MNFYPFHVGDYAKDTRHLTWDEDAAYRRLLDLYYSTERPIPLDTRVVFRLVVASTDAQRAAVETVLQEFFARTEDGWVNERAERELEAMRGKQARQRAAANKRWSQEKACRSNATVNSVAMPWHTKSDAMASKTDASESAEKTEITQIDDGATETAKNADADAMPWHTKSDAMASKNDAVAMPPIPIPIPIYLANFQAGDQSAGDEKPQGPQQDAGDTNPVDPDNPLNDFFPGPKEPRGSRLPADWTLPDEWRDWAERHANELDIAGTADQFRDYWVAKSRAAGRKADWYATWRNWCRRANERNAGKQSDRMAYCTRNADARWWRRAGFESAWDATSRGCWHHNAHAYRDGRKVEVAA